MGSFLIRVYFLSVLSAGVLLDPSQGVTAEAEVAHSKTLSFGVYTHIRSTEMLKKMEPFRKYLEDAIADKGLTHSINMRIYPSYGRAIEALAGGEVDFVRFGPVSYVLAKKKNPSIQLLAIESNNGKKFFNGVLSVAAASKIQSIDQLRGENIAFGSRKSTTGRYLAQAELVKAGIMAGDLSGHTYLGRHDKVVYAVASGKYAAGASNENTFNKYAKSKGLRKLLEFPCVTKPWVASGDLSQELVDSLRTILLELQDPNVLKTIKRSGFLPGSDVDYNQIRHAMALAKQFDTETIRVATYAGERPSRVFAKVYPILKELENYLDDNGWHVHFESRIYSTYAKAINAMANGLADLARMGAASYVLSKDKNDKLQLLVSEEVIGEPHHGVFVVKNSSKIRTIFDLKRASVAFGSKNSTLGSYVPKAELIKNGIKPEDLGSYGYLGRHDKVALGVYLENYDVGAMREETFNRYREAKNLRSIHVYTAPYHAWVAAHHLDGELAHLLREGFIAIKDKQTFANINRTGFKMVDDSLYDQVREAIQLSKGFQDK
ncbi:MAG: PhnD/SsuA/transferrin family substrate-binding protein [Magnetococcales bacterium]|nr:PhnD/SsuA/transferrin family substrate-binding protein [Magnetococcales bacterium]